MPPSLKRLILGMAFLLASLSLSIMALAHEGTDHEHEHAAPVKVGDAELHRPTPMPDRVVLTWYGDPATSVAASWRTDTSVEQAMAEIAEGEAGPNFVRRARSVDAETVDFASDLGASHYHSVKFADLKPRTTYVYRVGDGQNWSEWFQFRTASDQDEPFSFIYFGDAQNDVRSMWSRVIRQAHADMPKASFMLHAGDLINVANADANWGEWFAAGGWLNAMIPVVPTPGNHEYGKLPRSKGSSLSGHWRPQFVLPENGPEGLEETAYWLDYQGARIISLNSNEDQERQVAWLDRVLADNPHRWSIVTFHHPMYSASKTRDNAELRAAWQPIFDKHQVDLVLQGHDHSYARTGLMRSDMVGTLNVPDGLNLRADSGTVYVVSVSGPKMYDRKQPRPAQFERIAEDTQLYQIVTVDGDSLRFEARTALGELYDAFTLAKRDGQPNELIEQTPDTPERVREPDVVAETPVPRFQLHAIDAKNVYSGAAVFDVDHDGLLDIVTGGTWYQAPAWTPHKVREVEHIRGRYDDYSCLPLDVNGDGYFDFLTCNYRSEKLAWIEHPGAGLGDWTEHVIEKPGPMETGRLADVDQDGQMDVLPNGRDFAAWWEVTRGVDKAGKPGLVWVRHDLPQEMTSHGVGFGDINGDGRGDIVAAEGWLEAPEDRRKGRWTWHPDFHLDRDASVPILVYDVDGDGDNDIAWGRGHRTGLCWLEQTGAVNESGSNSAASAWAHHVIDSSWSQPHTVECADLDNDGQLELIAGKRFMGHDGRDIGEWDPLCLYWYDFDAPTRTFTRHTLSQSAAAGVGPGFDLDPKIVDLDGDGDLDIVAPGRSGLYVFENLLAKGSLSPATLVESDLTPPASFADHTWLIDKGATAADWANRRAAVLTAMQEVMGPLPDPSRRVPLDIEVGEVEDRGKYVRKHITFASEPGRRVPAYLLVPKNLTERAPAMLCLHPTGADGKRIAAGLAGKSHRGYAAELAERGIVCVVPDYPSMGEHLVDFGELLASDSASELAPGQYASASMMAIWDNIRAIDVLESLPEVNPERIGAIGHSLGGHNALFTAVFDSRIKAVVSSCGFTTFARYKGGDLSPWAQDKYMPRVRERFECDAAKMPFDFHEVVAAIAPRAVFVSAPVADDNFDVAGVREVAEAAEGVYSLVEAADKLVVVHPECQHDFPDEVREQAYEWLKSAFKK